MVAKQEVEGGWLTFFEGWLFMHEAYIVTSDGKYTDVLEILIF